MCTWHSLVVLWRLMNYDDQEGMRCNESTNADGDGLLVHGNCVGYCLAYQYCFDQLVAWH